MQLRRQNPGPLKRHIEKDGIVRQADGDTYVPYHRIIRRQFLSVLFLVT